MNTKDGSEAMEQQTLATDAAGCKSEVDRSVQGTGLPGFAELRARALDRISEADYWIPRHEKAENLGGVVYDTAQRQAFYLMVQWLDELSGCEG
jgi:hypothetical protein